MAIQLPDLNTLKESLECAEEFIPGDQGLWMIFKEE